MCVCVFFCVCVCLYAPNNFNARLCCVMKAHTSTLSGSNWYVHRCFVYVFVLFFCICICVAACLSERVRGRQYVSNFLPLIQCCLFSESDKSDVKAGNADLSSVPGTILYFKPLSAITRIKFTHATRMQPSLRKVHAHTKMHLHPQEADITYLYRRSCRGYQSEHTVAIASWR